MGKNPDPSTIKNHPSILRGILKRVVTVATFFALTAAILFLGAGTIYWSWAWIFLGLLLLTVIIGGTILLINNPETVAERGEIKILKGWDRLVSSVYIIGMYFALPLVAGLDVRYDWTQDLCLGLHLAGVVALIIGLILTVWALFSNTYFSMAVRIQSERGHVVCSSGPYRIIRHPGYAGYILQALSTSILLGSLWALIPAIIASVALVLRTSFEDRLLQSDLPGYQEYSHKVRFRLVPGIW
jgi:protein-S-isoprenylcysteine O-methyltransferase Ste14